MKKITQKIIFGLIFALTSGTSSISAVELTKKVHKEDDGALKIETNKKNNSKKNRLKKKAAQKKAQQEAQEKAMELESKYKDQCYKEHPNVKETIEKFEEKEDLYKKLGIYGKIPGKITQYVTDEKAELDANKISAMRCTQNTMKELEECIKKSGLCDFRKSNLLKELSDCDVFFLGVREAGDAMELKYNVNQFNKIVKSVSKKLDIFSQQIL